MELWIVGKYIESTENGVAWEFQGVFESEELAVEACRKELYFVCGPVKLNKNAPDESVNFEKAYYPLLK